MKYNLLAMMAAILTMPTAMAIAYTEESGMRALLLVVLAALLIFAPMCKLRELKDLDLTIQEQYVWIGPIMLLQASYVLCVTTLAILGLFSFIGYFLLLSKQRDLIHKFRR